MQETRKILIWGIPVLPAGRTGEFKGVKWGIPASAELSLNPGGRLYTQVGVLEIVLFLFLPNRRLVIEVQNSIPTRPHYPPPADLVLVLLGVLRGLYSFRFCSALHRKVDFILN